MADQRKPWIKWYTRDWRGKPALRMCSYAARGLWIDMLTLMAEAEHYGFLLVEGVGAPTPRQLAGLLGGTEREIAKLLAELRDANVYSVTGGELAAKIAELVPADMPAGVILSRRMVRDKAKADRDRTNGSGGGNPKLRGKVNPGVNPHANPQRSEIRGQRLEREEPHPAAASPPASASGTAAAAPEVVIPMPAPDVGNPRLDDQLDIPPKLDRRPATQAAISDRALVDEAYQLWLPVAFELGISDVGHLNRDRRDALSARLAEVGGIEGWRVFLEKIREAEFLREPDGRPKFWVGLSKLLQPEHFSKVLEGRYAERHRAERPDERSVTAGLAGLAEAGSG